MKYTVGDRILMLFEASSDEVFVVDEPAVDVARARRGPLDLSAFMTHGRRG